jgi:predicted nucleic acid-binding protein
MSNAPINQHSFVFDTSVLSAFAEAERLDVLGSLIAGTSCHLTDIVQDEIQRGSITRPQLSAVENAEWLQRGSLATDEELRAYLRWVERVGAGEHDQGEASIFAFAEVWSMTAIIDDGPATRVARAHGLDVHGSLWLIAGFVRDGKLTEHAASGLIDALRAVGSRLPCTGSQFPAWARAHDLLSP